MIASGPRKRLYTRTLQLCTLALLAMAAKADIPDFQYFYSCDSGVVDCTKFGTHHSARVDFPDLELFDDGFGGPQFLAFPVVDSSQGASISVVAASNDRGQAIVSMRFIGQFQTGGPDGGIIDHGKLYNVAGENFTPIDINNNGVWLGLEAANGFFVGAIGPSYPISNHGFFQGSSMRLRNAVIEFDGFIALNDQDQVLINVGPRRHMDQRRSFSLRRPRTIQPPAFCDGAVPRYFATPPPPNNLGKGGQFIALNNPRPIINVSRCATTRRDLI